jgi:hypothetical protein
MGGDSIRGSVSVGVAMTDDCGSGVGWAVWACGRGVIYFGCAWKHLRYCNTTSRLRNNPYHGGVAFAMSFVGRLATRDRQYKNNLNKVSVETRVAGSRTFHETVQSTEMLEVNNALLQPSCKSSTLLRIFTLWQYSTVKILIGII